MIANPQATTHEPTRCPVKFNRPKYAGRACLMKRPVFRPLKSRRMAARRGFRLGHDGLPLAFGSLCARLAAFHFEIKAKMNADDPCESPAERPSCPSEPQTLPNQAFPPLQRNAGRMFVSALLQAVGVQTCFYSLHETPPGGRIVSEANDSPP